MKEKKLIFGIFRPIDLVIFICGVCITFILLIVFANRDSLLLLALLPVIICTILVMPLKKYHNVLEAIKHIIKK